MNGSSTNMPQPGDEHPGVDRPSGATPAETAAVWEAGTPGPTPWVTWLSCAACVLAYLGLAGTGEQSSWDTLSRWGYCPADEVWNGHYWSLITSAFVHLALWHVAFNVYWLWQLGNVLERAIGPLRFACFVVVAAFVSSAWQLAVSDSTGHGASGVVYGIFGLMWCTRDRFPRFAEVVTKSVIQLFLIWLVGCVIATYLNIWAVGNGAHISGLAFGALTAGAFFREERRWLMRAGFAGIILAAVVPLFWCPWSITWLSLQAYNAHAAGKTEEAISRYTQIIARDHKNAWAYASRAALFKYLGRDGEAHADLERAQQLDSANERVLQGE